MWRLTVCFLFASILSARAGVDLGAVIGNISSVVRTYDEELDRAVPFRELRASLGVLDSLASSYHGNCQRDIAAASQLGYAAAGNFYKAIDMVFSWCVEADFTCDIIIIIDLVGCNTEDWLTLTQDMLIDGLQKIQTSLELLVKTRRQLTSMRAKLASVPSALQAELSGKRADYARGRNERLSAVEDEQRRRDNEAAVSIASGTALLFLGPIGAVLGAGAITYGASQPEARLDSQEEERKAKELEIVQTFLTSLRRAVQVTIDRISDVRESLNREIRMDYELHGSTSGNKDIIEYFGAFPKEQIEKFQKTLRSFMTRHRGGGVLARPRREATRGAPPVEWRAIRLAVDRLLGASALERERNYWTLDATEGSMARFL